MFRFEELEIWNLSLAYAKKVYVIAEKFPRHEVFGLTSQVKRASLSVSSNIAEGTGSSSVKDFCKFLDISIKSTLETISQMRFAKEMGYITDESLGSLYKDTEKLVRKTRMLKKPLSERRAISDLRRARIL